MSHIMAWLRRYLAPPLGLSRVEQRYFRVASLTYPFGIGLHGLMIVLPLTAFYLPQLSAYNVFSVAVWIVALVLIRRRRLVAASVLGSLEIMLHAFLCGLWLGWLFGFQYYLVTLLAVTFISPIRRWLQFAFALASCGLFLLLAAMPTVWQGDPLVPARLQLFNMVSSLALMVTLGAYNRRVTDSAEAALEEAHAKSEGLLLNILPDVIAERLKHSDNTIADAFAETSVLFADIADFTPLSQSMTPAEVVQLLDDLFSRFDVLVRKHKLEKIKTIGDAYMVAAGVPTPRADHAQVMALLAQDIRQAMRDYNAEKGTNIRLRIGINSGPVVAGVIGKMRFLYDLWGDCVNTASRMESHGVPDEIQISENTKALLDGKYDFEDRGLIDIKGKGPMRTYFLREALAERIIETA